MKYNARELQSSEMQKLKSTVCLLIYPRVLQQLENYLFY